MWPMRSNTSQPDPPAKSTILVVDDEAPVRDLQHRMLTRAGYEVTLVDDAEKALRIIQEDRPIDCVIADVHMPGMNGDEMARRIRAVRPDQKILFVTGFADTLFNNQPVLWQNQAYLDKPFTQRGLLEAVSLLITGNLGRATT
jgi:two-component system, cell cycle sensor histidine kinase and response regulator CckA